MASDRQNHGRQNDQIINIEAEYVGYDAAICALQALSFADRKEETHLPPLVGPVDKGIDDAVLRAEGWIYHWK